MEYKLIREHYELKRERILHTYNKCQHRWTSPYSNMINWPEHFSPIELDFWLSVRSFGGCPLYPQYPVGNYFSDFGHPGPKIAVECDGKQWHQDKEKDDCRDEDFMRMGWTTFRITGADIFKNHDQYPEIISACIDGLEGAYNKLIDYYMTTSEGLLRSLSFLYFGFQPRIDEEVNLFHKCLLNRVCVGEDKFRDRYDIITKNHKNEHFF